MITPALSDTDTKRNNTSVNYPKEKSLPHFLNKCANQYPGKTAIKFNGRIITYKELYESSNKLSKILIDSGVKSGDIVAVALDRSPEMIVSLLAVLKSGAAYIPLDPDYPSERLRDMLLPDDVGELLRPVFAGDDLVTHENKNVRVTTADTEQTAVAAFRPWRGS